MQWMNKKKEFKKKERLNKWMKNGVKVDKQRMKM